MATQLGRSHARPLVEEALAIWRAAVAWHAVGIVFLLEAVVKRELLAGAHCRLGEEHNVALAIKVDVLGVERRHAAVVSEARDGALRCRVEHDSVVEEEEVAVAALRAVAPLAQVGDHVAHAVAAVLEHRRVLRGVRNWGEGKRWVGGGEGVG
eukprot:365636-Chlamydomonas_euryale.AAC.11